MTKLALDKDVIVKRLDGIEAEVTELQKLAQLPHAEYASGVGHKLTQYHLHRALEGMFNISSHVLSRIPGATATQYKEIAQKMGEHGIVSKEFAENKLTKMAKYRNRLVHFYAEITPDELHKILQEDLGNFDIFLDSIKKVLTDPQVFGLTID